MLAATSLFIPVFSSFWIVLSFSFYGSHFWMLDCKLIQMKLLFHYLPPCVWVLSVELFHRSTGGCNASTKAGKKSVKLADIEVKDARLKIHQMLSKCLLLAHLVIARGFTQCILHCTKWKFIKQHNFCVFTRKTLHVPGSCQRSTPSHWLLQQLQLLTTLCIMITAHSVDNQHPEKWHSATIPHSLLC